MYNTNFTFALLHFLQIQCQKLELLQMFNPLHYIDTHTQGTYIACPYFTSSVSLLILTGV